MTHRLALLGSAFFLVALSSAALADTQTALGNRTGEGSTPFTTLAASPEANLYNGSVSTQIAIQVPPGRKNMTPEIALAYSSAGGPSPYGYGWNLPIGSIERSTKWGVPRCSGAHTNDFVLMMPGGVSAELVVESGSVYRPKVEEAFVEATAFKGTGTGNYWVVRDRAGLKYTFGRNLNQSGSETDDARVYRGQDSFFQSSPCRFTTKWMLTKIEDANGGSIEISWDKDHNVPVPVKISYGGSKGGAGSGAAVIAHFFHLTFEYLDLPPTYLLNGTFFPSGVVSNRSGAQERISRFLSTIRVATDKPTQDTEIRTYELEHSNSPGTYFWDPADPGTLENVRVTLGGAKLASYGEQDFTYMGHVTVGLQGVSDSELIPAPQDYLRHTTGSGEVYETLLDMNGDGILDSVVRADANGSGQPCSTVEGVWEVRFGNLAPDGELSFLAPIDWCVPPGVIDNIRDVESLEQAAQVDTFDMTGDGIPDWIYAFANPWLVYPGGCLDGDPGDGICSKWGFSIDDVIEWQLPDDDTEIFYIQDVRLDTSSPPKSMVHVDTIDVNGDGLPDYVDTRESTSWRVYYNNGRGFDRPHQTITAPVGYLSISQYEFPPNPRVLDFNGDGLLDVVEVGAGGAATGCGSPGAGYASICLAVHYGTGTGFDAAAFVPAPMIGPYIGDDSDEFYDWDLFDISGDGLPDMVIISDQMLWVSLNTGGRLENVVWDDTPPAAMVLTGVTHVARAPRTWTGGHDGTGPTGRKVTSSAARWESGPPTKVRQPTCWISTAMGSWTAWWSSSTVTMSPPASGGRI